MIQTLKNIGYHIKRTIIVSVGSLVIGTLYAGTNSVVVPNVELDNIDKVNVHMNQEYNLQLKADKSLILTGYNIQDISTRTIKTYSVLHVEF